MTNGKGKPAKRKSLKIRRASARMSKQVGAGEVAIETLSAVRVIVERNSPCESKKSSPLMKADVTASPKKRGLRSGVLSSPKLAEQSLHSHSPSPSKRVNVNDQGVGAGGEETLECKKMDDLDKAPCSPNLYSEVPIDPVKSTNVSNKANENIDKELEDVPSLQTVAMESWNIESRSEETIHGPFTSVKFQSPEEAILGSDVSKDTSLCRQLEDVILSSPEEGSQAGVADEDHDKALSTSTSSPRLDTLSPSVLGTAEPKTDADDVEDKSIDSFESLDNEQSGNKNPEPSDNRRVTDIESIKNEPDPSIFYEGESVKFDSSRLEVDQEVIIAFTCDANGSPNDSQLGTKDHEAPGNTSIILVTHDSPMKDEASVPREHPSRTPSDYEAPHITGPDCPESVAEVSRVTRSGSRFSEETNMLRDFLSRAQAQKAARDVSASSEVPGVANPRRSPRKPLVEIHNESPSPEKTLPVSKRPGTPPGKARLELEVEEVDELDELDELDEVEEAGQQTSSCRRSTRRRLFTPARPAPGAPSLIPVRRPEGGDKVRLQRSLAQELATITRMNTRRNRGQSKPPKVVLQNLPVEPLTLSVVSAKGEGCGKSVGWDATLVYYQATSGVAPGKERQRRKRNGRVEAPGEGNGSAGLKKETTGASTVNARPGSQGCGRNNKK